MLLNKLTYMYYNFQIMCYSLKVRKTFKKNLKKYKKKTDIFSVVELESASIENRLIVLANYNIFLILM